MSASLIARLGAAADSSRPVNHGVRFLFYSHAYVISAIMLHEWNGMESYYMSNNKNLIEIDPEKLGGTPVFYGTRVPIQNLFDCLETGESLDQFLEQFPSVNR